MFAVVGTVVTSVCLNHEKDESSGLATANISKVITNNLSLIYDIILPSEIQNKILQINFISPKRLTFTTNIILISLINPQIPTSKVNRPWCNAEHLSPSGSEIKNEWSNFSTPLATRFTVCSGTTVTTSLQHNLHNSQGFTPFSLPPTSFQTNFTTKSGGNSIESSDRYNYISFSCLNTQRRKDVQTHIAIRNTLDMQTPPYRPRTSPILTVTRTIFSVKDAEET